MNTNKKEWEVPKKMQTDQGGGAARRAVPLPDATIPYPKWFPTQAQGWKDEEPAAQKRKAAFHFALGL